MCIRDSYLFWCAHSPNWFKSDERRFSLWFAACDPFYHRRADNARAYGVNPNISGCILQRSRSRELNYAAFGGAVGRHVPETYKPGYRRCIDYGSTFLPEHLGNLVLHAQPHTFEIDVDNTIPVLLGAVCCRGADSFDTCVVVGAVQSVVGPDCRADQLLNIGSPVSYTHLRAHETKANLVCRLLLEKKKKTKNINMK